MSMEVISVVPKDIEITVAFTQTDMKAIYDVLDSSIIRGSGTGLEPEAYGVYRAFFALLENCVTESEDGP